MRITLTTHLKCLSVKVLNACYENNSIKKTTRRFVSEGAENHQKCIIWVVRLSVKRFGVFASIQLSYALLWNLLLLLVVIATFYNNAFRQFFFVFLLRIHIISYLLEAHIAYATKCKWRDFFFFAFFFLYQNKNTVMEKAII